jgi:hypothetical protein
VLQAVDRSALPRRREGRREESTRLGCRAGDVAISWDVAGPAGKDGAPGTNGVDGKNGAPGADGVSVTGSTLAAGDAHCANGGSASRPQTASPTPVTARPAGTAPTGSTGRTERKARPAPPDPRPAGDFSSHFASPNGEFALDVSNTGITLSGPHASIQLSNVGITLKGIGMTQIDAGVLELNAVPTIIGSCGSPDHAVRAGDVAPVVGPLGAPVLIPPGSNQLLVC